MLLILIDDVGFDGRHRHHPHRRRAAGQGRIEQTEAFLFSADETMDVGNEFGSR